MQFSIKVLEDSQLDKIHYYSLKLLEEPGMKIMNEKMLNALKQKGAKVDFTNKIVRFKPEIIEEAIDLMRRDVKEGRIPVYLNGVTSEITGKTGIQAKFGGACVQFLDWENKLFRDPSENDLINMVKLGQATPEVATVGNPVVYLKDNNNRPVEPRMQRVKTAALVAKYTTKPGPTEVWNRKELDFLIEIGSIVKGDMEKYIAEPCFITAKETIAPFILEENSADVLLALASKDLPCLIIPMPIAGVSSPVDPFGNIIIGNAEILATAAAIKSIYPQAKILGGIISGSMDMTSGTANFATPEATLQDIGLSELYERKYGFNFGIGCYLDAKYPGIQNVMEKSFKYFALAGKQRYTYAVGLVNGGKCFSAEQAMLDIQILKNLHKFLEGIVLTDEEEILELIRKVNIGGSFLQEANTLFNHKKFLMIPELFDHTLSQGLKKDLNLDILFKAHDKVEEILSRDDLYVIDSDRANAIDAVVKKAIESL
jgi:trimethylamine---corrinoid protein Co-methyltransferase